MIMPNSEKLIFISWSGERSKMLAKAIAKKLNLIVPGTTSFMSEDDISKGERGLSVIENNLKKAIFGIICLTPENKDAPWINFEAGAISNQIQEQAKLSQIMFELEPSDLSQSPLRQFQATFYTKDDFKKLFISIGSILDNEVIAKNISQYFEQFWPELKADIDKVLSTNTKKSQNTLANEDPQTALLKNMSRQINSINHLLQNPERILPDDHLRNAIARASDVSGTIGVLENDKLNTQASVLVAIAVLSDAIRDAEACFAILADDNVSDSLRNFLTPLINDIITKLMNIDDELRLIA